MIGKYSRHIFNKLNVDEKRKEKKSCREPVSTEIIGEQSSQSKWEAEKRRW